MNKWLLPAVLALVLVAITVLLPAAPVGAGVSAGGRSEGAPDRVLVQFKPGTSAAHIEAAHYAARATSCEQIEGLDVHVVHVPAGRVHQAIATYRRYQGVAFVEPDYVYFTRYVTDDPFFADQGNLWQVAAPDAWDINRGSPEVVIAVVDTGVDLTHPDLQGKLVPGVNLVSPDSPPLDDNGHGTHVAGTAAADSNNAIGVAGLGFQSRIAPVKVLDRSGVGFASDIARGIIWAVDNGADVINLSLGSFGRSLAVEQAVNLAWARGAILVAAAGNERNSIRQYPAAFANVIAVAAVDHQDRRAAFSTFGTWVEVAAPGVDVISTTPTYPVTLTVLEETTPEYGRLSGSSQATPLVSGLAALVKAQAPQLDNAAVRDIILANADPVPGTGTLWQAGRINAARALQAAQQRSVTATLLIESDD